MTATTLPPSTTPGPSRRLLEALAEEASPHLGSLSYDDGLMPVGDPPTALPPSHEAWDQAAAELPRMWRDLSARRELPELPLQVGEIPNRGEIVAVLSPEENTLSIHYRAQNGCRSLEVAPGDQAHGPVGGCAQRPWMRLAILRAGGAPNRMVERRGLLQLARVHEQRGELPHGRHCLRCLLAQRFPAVLADLAAKEGCRLEIATILHQACEIVDLGIL